MNFTEATSSDRNFRRVGDTKSEFFWRGTGEDRELMERVVGTIGDPRQPRLTWRDYFRGEFEFVEDRPVIEVGDVVEYERYHHDVLYIDRERRCSLLHQIRQALVNPVEMHQLKLIRKGPKVHVFEGVKFTIVDGLNVNCMLDQLSILSPNETYTVTLKKEERS